MSRDNSKLLVLGNRLRMQIQQHWGERLSLETILNNRAGLLDVIARAKKDPRVSEIAKELEREVLGIPTTSFAPTPAPTTAPTPPVAKSPTAPDLAVPDVKKDDKEDDKDGKGDAKKGKKDPRAYLGGLR